MQFKPTLRGRKEPTTQKAKKEKSIQGAGAGSAKVLMQQRVASARFPRGWCTDRQPPRGHRMRSDKSAQVISGRAGHNPKLKGPLHTHTHMHTFAHAELQILT